ncbi:STAS domain-containing protein [Lamprobacter modestohalophilus]|uniref:STAS domain-containing protein n=1 Tax=Lamprobacter modestohalophilus TaxID=1064514 RepID=UPI002ADED1B9|nr:STAS domain-containing protein [Lamprobacter modestohalophilus]MEA1051942.1 STAS domain-containing protein [Lamprobacter modestohalophilus]
MTLSLSQVLSSHQDQLLNHWLHDLSQAAADSGLNPAHPELMEPLRALFWAIIAQLNQEPAQQPNQTPSQASAHAPDQPAPLASERSEQQAALKTELKTELQQLIAKQARLQRNLSDTLGFLLHLKHLVLKALLTTETQDPADRSILWLDQCFEQIARQAFDSALAERDRYISEQSLSIMELSTPVLRLWHQILLLPLVGVIDTGRARQVTDHLLEAIAKYEARVTVIDLTGVPIIDTSVAQHIMKTVDAARLLGSRVVLTGISPDGAQTLTKLGIRFGDVISRASLRAGIAEALLITGKRISAMDGGAR